MPNFNIRLRELRNSKGLSQQQLADIVGMSKSSINMYERGDREPGLELLEAFADYFNVDMDYLVGKTNNPRKNLITSNKPDNAELEEDIIMYHRDGKTVRKKMTKEQIKMLAAMIDALPEDDNPDL